jgi:hypothetical protein
LGSRTEQAVARWRRQAFDNDLRYVDHVLRTGADVPDDEAPAQPRRQTTDAEKAYALWGREQEREANAAAQQDAIQGWLDYHRASSIFERKRR